MTLRPRHVAIVPHTHWDREWYEPYQTFRLRLVKMLDELIPLLEGDPSYARFLLDGQMAVVDDYLEVRPHNEDRIRALAAAGRLSMGPWYILMDEFLVSGETIVRDLQSGLLRGAAFGGAMEVGYLPDMFGHIAQMPQILALAGFGHAVVWRGVPSAVTKTGFVWEAPDGSSVRAEYLPTGYGNGASIPDDAKALVRRVGDHEEEIGEFLLDGMLFMNGTDHQEPQPWLGRVVAEANELQDDYVLEVTTLPEYLAGAPTEGLKTWKGEMRSGARADILMGVASNRVDVKRAAARAERALERLAEPLCALLHGARGVPGPVAGAGVAGDGAQRRARLELCVLGGRGRRRRARAVRRGLPDRRGPRRSGARGLHAVAGRGGADRGQRVGPGPGRDGRARRDRRGDARGQPGAARDPRSLRHPPGLGPLTLDANTVRTILGMLPSGSQIDTNTWIQGVHVDEDASGIDITIAFGNEETFDVPLGSIKQDLYTRLGARPDAIVRIQIDQPPVRSVLVRVEDVAGFGHRGLEPVVPRNPVTVEEPTDPAGALVMGNGLVTVAFDGNDGTFAIDGVAGFGRLVDGGDHGDSYNYSPPAGDRIVDTPDAVTLTVKERGPVRAVISMVAHYTWPDYVDGRTRSRTGEVSVEVTTDVEVRAEERIVRITTQFVNPASDHRLRVHLPLPQPAEGSDAECAFAVVHRGLETEGRPDEFGLPTFPSRRFVSAGGLTVAHEGLLEYELVDIEGEPTKRQAATLAVTLLRSTGMLSRLGMAYRPLPAGPLTPVDGLQLRGRRIEARYALCLGCDDPYAMVDDVFLPLDVVYAAGGGWRPASGSSLEIEGAEVSAVRRQAGMLEVRVFNPTDRASTVRVGARSGWLVDLRGRTLEPVDGSFELRPFGIATFRSSRLTASRR